MKTLQVQVPDQLARELEEVVANGWFENADEAVRAALREFVAHRRFALMERQQLDDVAWALKEAARQE